MEINWNGSWHQVERVSSITYEDDSFIWVCFTDDNDDFHTAFNLDNERFGIAEGYSLHGNTNLLHLSFKTRLKEEQQP